MKGQLLNRGILQIESGQLFSPPCGTKLLDSGSHTLVEAHSDNPDSSSIKLRSAPGD
jgi:hypothetical protein